MNISKSVTIGRSLLLAGMFALSTSSVLASGDAEGGANKSQYEIGKKVFKEKVICASCPHADLALDETSVAAILPELGVAGDIGKSLSSSERDSLAHYIKRRFNL